DGRIVVDDDAAFAVEDTSARCEHGYLTNAVLLGQHAVVGGTENLYPPQAGAQHKHHERHNILRGAELNRRQLFAAAERVRIVVVEDHCGGSFNFDCAFRLLFIAYSHLLAELEAVQQEEDRNGEDRVHNSADKFMDWLSMDAWIGQKSSGDEVQHAALDQ